MTAIQPQVLQLITGATTTNTSWLLTSSGVFVDTQTITISGVVFTTVNALSVAPAVAGEVLIGANAAATLTNLTAAINAPNVTTTTFTALSAADGLTIIRKGLSATTTATVMTLVSSNGSSVTVSETETNAAWSFVTTSPSFGLNGEGKASLQFTAASISAGNGVFTVQASNDGSNWVAYNRLTTNATNTNAQTDTRVASVTLSSNTSSLVVLPDPFAFYRVLVTITTDGSYSATAYSI